MAAAALLISPTVDGWGVPLTDGQDLARYRGGGGRSNERSATCGAMVDRLSIPLSASERLVGGASRCDFRLRVTA